MNRIIVFPGKADSVFFLNEIDYMRTHFDDIVVMSYPGDNTRFKKIAQEKGFRYHIIKPSIIRTMLNSAFYKWLVRGSTREEIGGNFSWSRAGFARLAYIFHYGMFSSESHKYVTKELFDREADNVYLYSYWLSRGAYAIASYNMERPGSTHKIISRAHGYDLYQERNSLGYLPFRDYISENLDEIHFVSNHGLRYFSEARKKHGAELMVSRLGTHNKKMIRKSIRNKEKICVASCSSIVPVKRLDLIVDVIQHAKLPIQWIHLGDGPQKDEIIEYANGRLGRQSFRFLGQVDNRDVLHLYNNYDVDFLINMSDSEGIPVSIMEAMSMGIPVIARNVGGNREIVDSSRGLIIEDLTNRERVFDDINREFSLRLFNQELYRRKHSECIDFWRKNHNADSNYELFFASLVGE